MDVYAALSRCFENRLREDQSVRRDDGEIRVKRSKLILFLGIPQGSRRADLDPKLFSDRMDLRLTVSLSAPRRARWLRVSRDDVMTGRNQRPQRGDGKIRRSEEDDAHRTPMAKARRIAYLSA